MLMSEERKLEWVLTTWAVAGDTSIKNDTAMALSGGLVLPLNGHGVLNDHDCVLSFGPYIDCFTAIGFK